MSEDRRELEGMGRAALLRRGAVAAAAAAPLVRAAAAWPGIARPAQARELRIGHLNTLSGPQGLIGIDTKKGIVAYVKSRGGRIGGRRIRLVDADDALDPATGIRQVRKLVLEDKVDVILGITFGLIGLAVRDTIDELKVPTVITNTAANALTRERRSAYIYRISYSDWQIGASLGRWAAQRFPTGMVTATANYAAGQEIASGFREVYEGAGGKLVGDTILLPFPSAPDYQPYISQIQARSPRAVWVFPTSGTESVKFVRAYAQLGLKDKVPLIGINNLVSPQAVLQALGEAGVGIRAQAAWSEKLKNAENKRFLAVFGRLFGGEPSDFSALGYTAAQFLDLALRMIRGDTSDKGRLLRAMARVGTWLSVSGKVSMDAGSHNVIRPFYLVEVTRTPDGRNDLQLRATLGIFKDPGS